MVSLRRIRLLIIYSHMCIVNSFHQGSSGNRFPLKLFLSSPETVEKGLTEQQLDFTLGYLNKHHEDLLISVSDAFSSIGSQKAKENSWRGGSFSIESAKILHIDSSKMKLEVQTSKLQKREVQEVVVELDAQPVKERSRVFQPLPQVAPDTNRRPIDEIARKLCRLAWVTKYPKASGKMIQLAKQLDGAGIGILPENMYLNQVPHNRYVRQFFYDGAEEAVLEAVVLCSQKKITNRMKLVSQFPEMNPSMDSYRIGTILEMVRAIAIRLAEENLRVRVCVQNSMGVGIFTGLPKQLSGVSKLLQMMDWQAEEGEPNEGMLGDYIRFGAVGPEHVVDEVRDSSGNVTQFQDDVFIMIAPQSMVGTDTSIFPLLTGMVEKAGDRPVILVNPDLKDKPSAAGQQSVRGRQERIDFANSFETVYQFQNIYVSGTSYFPILGAITKLRPSEPWVAHQRRDFADNEGEIYVPVLAGESPPEGQAILSAFES